MSRRRRPAGTAWAYGVLLGLGSLGLAGCPSVTVIRLVEGVEVAGRYVSPAAYAAYSRGVEAEARSDPGAALAAYLAAVEVDDESVELWTRLGGLYCRLGRGADSDRAFAEAAELDDRYEPLWRARALCAAAQGSKGQVLDFAGRAVQADPDRPETVLLYAAALEQSGSVAQARYLLREAVLQHPYSAAVWEALQGLSQRQGDGAWSRYAARQLAELRRPRGERRPPADKGALIWAGVDDALRQADLELSRRRASRLRIDPRLLAARAIALGQPSLAKEQAELLLGADPADSDARLAVALAADLLGDQGRLVEVLELPPGAAPLSPVGRLLMAELLGRHAGAAEPEPWLPPAAAGAPDAVEQDLIARLTARLARRPGGS